MTAKKTNNKKASDYATMATAKRGAKRQFGDDWEKTHEIKQNKAKRFEIIALPTKVEPPKEILRQSQIESPCQFVWNMADKMSAKGAKRKDIIKACTDAGVAFYTARTQYQLWFKAKNATPVNA
jgi:hypothetical protein